MYDYEILYNILTAAKDSEIDLHVKESAAEYLVINIKKDLSLLKIYQLKSLSTLEANIDSSLRVMNLVNLLSNAMIVEHKEKNTLETINKNTNLFNRAFQFLIKYKMKVNEACAKDHFENPMKCVFQGENTHEDLIRGYFEF